MKLMILNVNSGQVVQILELGCLYFINLFFFFLVRAPPLSRTVLFDLTKKLPPHPFSG